MAAAVRAEGTFDKITYPPCPHTSRTTLNLMKFAPRCRACVTSSIACRRSKMPLEIADVAERSDLVASRLRPWISRRSPEMPCGSACPCRRFRRLAYASRIFPPRGPESPPSREAASSANSARGGVGAVGVRAIEALKHQPHSNPQARQARQGETLQPLEFSHLSLLSRLKG